MLCRVIVCGATLTDEAHVPLHANGRGEEGGVVAALRYCRHAGLEEDAPKLT